jgi:hypothetical protein
MFGYKVFNSDMTCRDFQYEVGKTYTHDGRIEICEAGFHFCTKAVDCFKYYDFSHYNKVCRVEALGNIIKSNDDSKFVTDKIRILGEVSWHEVLDLVNTGCDNVGYKNSGDSNSGGCNTGDKNSGNCNTGDMNSGNCNTGDMNSGNCNSGDRNSGWHNSGDRNSGGWNAGNHFSGFFCTGEAKMMLFNKPTDLTFSEVVDLIPFIQIEVTKWIRENDMTKEEKEEHPEYKTIGGYLKEIPYKEAWENWWKSAKKEDKNTIKNLPNFDAEIFLEITGIDIKEME